MIFHYDNPDLGCSCTDVRPGPHRMERGRHVVFYRQMEDRILVTRILHQRDEQGRRAGVRRRVDDPNEA